MSLDEFRQKFEEQNCAKSNADVGTSLFTSYKGEGTYLGMCGCNFYN
jgi:hypothetical protein